MTDKPAAPRKKRSAMDVVRSLRQPMTEDEVIALALRFLTMGRQRCGSTLGMLGFYHFGRCRVTRWERREVETLHRFEAMLRREETSVPVIAPQLTSFARDAGSDASATRDASQ